MPGCQFREFDLPVDILELIVHPCQNGFNARLNVSGFSFWCIVLLCVSLQVGSI